MSFEESLECNVGSLTEEVLQKLLEIDEWYFSDSDSEESEATEESEAEEEAKSPKPQGPWQDLCSNLLKPPKDATRLSTTSEDCQNAVEFFLSQIGPYDDIEDAETDENRDSEAFLLMEMEGGSTSSTPTSTLERRGDKQKEETVVTVPSLDKLPPHYYIARELLTSERTYIQGIRLLEKVLHGSVKTAHKTKKPILPEFYRKKIFLNIGEIHALNLNLLEELEKRMEQWNEESIIADLLATRAPFFKLYSMYTSRFEDAQIAFIEAVKRYKPFAELVQVIENSTICRGLPLSSYMLYPIQRIPRYRLLLEDYKKRLPEDHSDIENTKSALKAISEVAQHLDNRIKDLEQQAIVVKHQKMFTGKETLVIPGRRFLLRGPIELVSGRKLNKRKQLVLFVFSDIALLATVTRKLKFKIKHKFPLETLQISSMQSQVTKNSFCLFTPAISKPFRLCARNEREREKFVSCIRLAIDKEVERSSSFNYAKRTQSLTDSFSKRVYNGMLKDPVLQSRWRKGRKLEVLATPSNEPIDDVDSPDGPVDMNIEFDEFEEESWASSVDNTLSSYLKHSFRTSDDASTSSQWEMKWFVLNYSFLIGYANHKMDEASWALPLQSCSMTKSVNNGLYMIELTNESSIHSFQFDNEYDYTRWYTVLESNLENIAIS